MENASKALIIAGAILIAILLITIGIIVMNSINEPIDQATDEATQQAIEMFNSKFTAYSGTQRASAVKALMTKVQSNTGSNTGHAITVAGGGFDTPAAIQAAVLASQTYTVTISDQFGPDAQSGTPDGYIDTINVTGTFGAP